MAAVAAALAMAGLLLASCASVNVAGPGPNVIRTSEIRSLGSAPIRGEAAVFAFRPVKGAPSEMLFALEDLIKVEAKARDIKLVQPGDTSATYVVQGFVSAVGDPHSALVTYVWDVYDVSGTRVHRFSGQQEAAGSGSDPWAGVTREVMAEAARETIDAIAEWIRV